MTQPSANAANMFPQAAAANPSIFYDKAGQSRSAADVYAKLSGKFEVARAVNFAPSSGVTAVAQTHVPDTAGVTQAFADANDLPALPDTKPLFQAMFSDRARAVTQTVSSLWGADKSGENTAAASEAKAQPGARGHDLFTDSPTDIRGMFRGSV
jgi:hypothetical protein